MTFDQLMAEGAAALEEAGIVNARLESRWLLAHVTGHQSSELISRGQDNVPEEAVGAFRNRVSRRAGREPIQHILGTTEFYGLEFLTDARALIPRPDSEIVVEAALGQLAPNESARIADLGAGSGCLLAAILANRPLASGTGVEASAEAASLARENLLRLGLSARADVHEGRWSEWQGWSDVDLIISNPPYIPSGDLAGLMPEVRDHDPAAALDGGPDGLVAYREIVRIGAAAMKPGAWLVFEIGHDQAEAVIALLDAAGFQSVSLFRDLGGNDRAIIAKRPVV
jgi:release factor glutamine methyltransferase